MEFRIADTFSDSLAKLTNEDQKAVKTTAFDLQMNPANPGMQFHKLDKVKDPNFWSVRVSSDIRLIVHKSKSSLLLCYVDHHDKAYAWAERRKLETHPKTGAAQLVEIRETIKEIQVPVYVESEQPKQPLFEHLSDETLLEYGVPGEWLHDVKQATEDTILDLADHLPGEAAEALLNLAVGEEPATPVQIHPDTDPFEHPDAKRRFRVMTNIEELEKALNYPWEKWMVFLHPRQQQLVEREFNGPARISGSAGTGKTIVALHRAVHLARKHTHARILLTSFSDALAYALQERLRILISSEPRLAERIEVKAVKTIGQHLYEIHFGPSQFLSKTELAGLINKSAENVNEHKFSFHFLLTEWEQVIDAWQIESWETYREVQRLGRKTRLPETGRKVLWNIYEQILHDKRIKGWQTTAGMFHRLAQFYRDSKHKPFDFIVVDEAQDISVARLKFISALAGSQTGSLFFAGDLGQRIFQIPFSWKSLGVDIRGRSHSLKINYRTSHQIRMQADRLLGNEIADVDGVVENRRGTVSVFNGPTPVIEIFENEQSEMTQISQWLQDRINEGIEPHEIGVFVRASSQLDRATKAIKETGLNHKIMDELVSTTKNYISVSTMHLAKGLEFRAVVVMACDDEVLTLQDRIERVTDDNDLEEVYNTERHLLYVACTRARDYLLVTGVEPGSEFLEDMDIGNSNNL